MRSTLKLRWLTLVAVTLVILLIRGPALAVDDFFLYGNQDASDVTELDIPEVDTSWFTAIDYFRDGPNQGRMLAATGKFIYIQDAPGSSTWTVVAEVAYTMDPAFVRISPSGGQVALGLGWGKNILVFDAAILDPGSPESPVNLNLDPGNPDVNIYPENHYDAAWVGETHLVINGGQWIIPGQSAASGVVSLDITDPYSCAAGLCGNIPGASSGIAVDANNNLVFGIGAGNNTGELKVWPANTWWTGAGTVPAPFNYNDPIGLKFAHSILSAAHLGFDGEGNLHAGGGRFVDPQTVNLESGYAALIGSKVIANAVASVGDPNINLYEVDETNGAQYREFGPDVCRNDTATGVLANGSKLSVNWNPATEPGTANCIIGSNIDWWQSGVVPRLTTYAVNATRDGDNDSVVDINDHSPGTPDAANVDTDGDGYGNIIDADFNNDGVVNFADLSEFQAKYGSADAEADMNNDGIVNFADLSLVQQQYGNKEPYYNF